MFNLIIPIHQWCAEVLSALSKIEKIDELKDHLLIAFDRKPYQT